MLKLILGYHAGSLNIVYDDYCNNGAPTRIWLYCIMTLGKICEKVSVLCMEAYKGQNFLTFDLIYDENVFIIVFKAVDSVFNN